MEGEEKNKKTPQVNPESQDFPFLQMKQAKENSFTVPQGYFDALPGRIRERIQEEKQVAPVRPFPKMILLAAAAAAVLVVIAFSLFLKSEYDNYGRSNLLSSNKNTSRELVMADTDLPAESDSNKRVKPNVNKPGEALNPVVKPGKVKDTEDARKQEDVLQTLEKEGISDEDILQYLLEENYDPIEIIN
jgi:hypothetical protein